MERVSGRFRGVKIKLTGGGSGLVPCLVFKTNEVLPELGLVGSIPMRPRHFLCPLYLLIRRTLWRRWSAASVVQKSFA